jgi:predicted dehydrogenase/threonine dehydrogenase-like Zn-dependent dehydrogenase
MKQVLIQGGLARVEEVPTPQVSEKNILVRVEYSCVSAGTEMAGVRNSGMPLYRRALKQPENVRRALDMAREQGIRKTLDRVSGQNVGGMSTGYSAAGTVVEIGSKVVGFRRGDRVACAGAGIANHAEFIDVPVNLTVKIPERLKTMDAATVTLGSIALQGVRRASPTLGETVVVLGLGLLGQLVTQMLVANGCRVIGSDLDPKRLDMALAGGMAHAVRAGEDLAERAAALTDGFGADAALVMAATPSHEVISQAMRATRRKGRVVLVGDVGLNLKRADFYEKELDFLISTSYGPGRYDPVYEEQGQDYPLPYVRWTENRNMEEYLNLLAEGRISLEHLDPREYSIDETTAAYEALKSGDKPLIVLLHYPARAEAGIRKVSPATSAIPPATGRTRVALVGAGAFATGIHLPNLSRLNEYFELHCVMSRTGSTAKNVATQYKAAYAATEYEAVLADPNVDLVLIATRHHLHGRMVRQALEAGKHVFIEKPLAMTAEELRAIKMFYERQPGGPLLMTGFNRRFSPPIARARKSLHERATPLMANYRMNAGFIPADHWVQGEEGGGRNLGEACHIYDLFNSLTGAALRSVQACAVQPQSKQWLRNDNFVATVAYEDGSVCTLTYSALGNAAYPKEQMEIFCDGKVVTLDDYKTLTITGSRAQEWHARSAQKGHYVELEALGTCLKAGGDWPIPLWQQLQATEIALQVEKALTAAAPDMETTGGDEEIGSCVALPTSGQR